LDTLRADELPCYGYARNTAPNLCAFASQNILFSRFYSQSSFTLDSHMSIFTGLYPSKHHMINMLKDTLNPAIMTLTQTLKTHGYRTIYAGVTDDPNLPLDKGLERGFDEIYSINSWVPEWRAEYEKLLPKFLDGKPTFMFLHTYYVHAPYLTEKEPLRYVPKSFPEIPLTRKEFEADTLPFYQFVLGEFRRRLTESENAESKTRNSAIVDGLRDALVHSNLRKARDMVWSLPGYEQYELYASWYWEKIDKKDPAMIAYVRSLYDERINGLDETLKPLLSFVSKPEVKRKTIVIFTADHGEEFMEHGEFDHGWNIYNTTTYVPFILSAPRVRQGTYDALGQSIDIYPTLLDIIGVKFKGQLEGKSLLPLLLGKPNATGDSYVISQHRGDTIQSIRDGLWKLYIGNQTIPQLELYNLKLDPGEKNNIVATNSGIMQNLYNTLRATLNGPPVYEPVKSEFPGWIDEEKKRTLIQEGYF